MEEKLSWAPAVGATIILTVIGTLALVVAGGWNWFSKFLDSQAAAWVQAIGTVIAIWVTGAASTRQIHAMRAEAARARLEDHDERLRQAWTVAQLAQDVCKKVTYCLKSADHLLVFSQEMYDDLNIKGMMEVLDAIPMYELLSAEALHGVVELKRCFRKLDNITDLAKRRAIRVPFPTFVPGGHPNCPTYGHPNCSTWPR